MPRCRNWDDDEDDDDYPSPEPMIGFVIPQSTAEEPEEPLSCTVHKKYQAKRKPRTVCEACWRMFIASHP